MSGFLLYFLKDASVAEGIIITPQIECKTIGDDASPKKPFSISMKTCYEIIPTRDSVAVKVQQVEPDGKWRTIDSSDNLAENFRVTFNIRKSGKYRCLVPHTECSVLSKRLKTSIYLKFNKDLTVTVFWCIMDDMRHLGLQLRLKMSPKEVYKCLLLEQSLQVPYGQRLLMSVYESDSDEEKEIAVFRLESWEVWQSVLFKKYHFLVDNTSDNAVNFVIKDDNDKIIFSSYKNFFYTSNLEVRSLKSNCSMENLTRSLHKSSSSWSLPESVKAVEITKDVLNEMHNDDLAPLKKEKRRNRRG